MNDKDSINIETYFKEGNHFIIPSYQRGYKWSVKKDNEKSSVDFFCKSLVDAFKNGIKEYFIEAITVVQENDTIIIVDGQQRTTTLILFFIALEDFEICRNIKLQYLVREDSDIFLKNLINSKQSEPLIDDSQDIFYFKKAINQIKSYLRDVDKKQLSDYIKSNVRLLFNNIPANKAVNTFIALNGLKAMMKEEELIKAQVLIKSSRDDKYSGEENDEYEWKINECRGRLARNWDKWLTWWNQENIKIYFGTGDNHPLYYLLLMYWNINKNSKSVSKIQDIPEEFTFYNFKEKFIGNTQDAKNNFEGLRKLQKSIEDLYNIPEKYNFLGLIINTSKNEDKIAGLIYFFNSEISNKIPIEEYAKWAIVGTSHSDIFKENEKKDKARTAISRVNEKYVFWDEKEKDFNDGRKDFATNFLLLFNILEDNKLLRKFDFLICKNKSLEHIYPKSKYSELYFDDINNEQGSIHCIGNLVLLYKNENSIFGVKSFEDKKDYFFDIKEKFKSRNLLHTISVFANKKWEVIDIMNNKIKIITKLNNYYGI